MPTTGHDEAALFGSAMNSHVEQRYRYQKHVAADVAAILPSDARTLLDVGCDDGYLISRLPGSLFLVGVDRRTEPLRKAGNRRTVGDITSLPFRSKSFDLVMANDVLEHMDLEGRASGLREMARVASKYIVVTVPFMEDLNLSCTRCFECGQYYHVNHHCASFGLDELQTLLNQLGYRCVLQVLSGDVWQSQPSDIVFLRRLLLLALPTIEDPLCPHCGSRKISGEEGELFLNKLLDKLALDLCLRDRVLADQCFVRTECINVYTKEDWHPIYSDVGFLDGQGRQVKLEKRTVKANRLSFTSPDLNRKEFVSTYSQLPYFVCEDVIPSGARITPKRPALVGFCLGKDGREPIELRVRGFAEETATLCVWSYDTYTGCHSPLQARVRGNFSLDLTIEHAELSRYGLVFQLATENSAIILKDAELLNQKGRDMVTYNNSGGQARFLCLPDERVLVSLPLYGSSVVELEWMRDPKLLRAPGKRSLSLEGQSSHDLRMVHELAGQLQSECGNLSKALHSIINEHQRLRTIYEQTFVRKLKRKLTRFWGSILVASGRRTYRLH